LPTEETVRSVLGTKFEDALAKCFPSASQQMLTEMGKEFHRLMQQNQYQATLFPHVKETLLALKKRGIKLAIATSKDREELDKAIVYNNLSGIFDITCCGKEYKEKPDPAMLKHMMEKFNAKPDECLMIGDTVIDIQFAANAGIKTIAVTFGAHSAEKLQSANPLALANSWTRLFNLIEEQSKCCSTQIYCRL